MADYVIAIWLWNGVEELDFAGPYEVLTAWARSSERDITVRTVASTAEPVTCSHGLRVIPDVGLAELGEVDLLVHPGGQTGSLLDDGQWHQRLRDLHEGGVLMTSVCNGAVVYGVAGLLDGRPAATHWSAVQALRDLGIAVDESARFVDDGDVVTSAGVSAGIDMALHLVARLESDEMSASIRRYIQYEPS
jgi:transcriptional regulator GlxA family with amidase domain